MAKNAQLKWHNGRMILEIDTTIRVPIAIEPMVHDVIGNIKLTRRENQTLEGLLKGQANKEIAGELHISERTVKYYVSALLAKFSVRTRGELIALFGVKPEPKTGGTSG